MGHKGHYVGKHSIKYAIVFLSAVFVLCFIDIGTMSSLVRAPESLVLKNFGDHGTIISTQKVKWQIGGGKYDVCFLPEGFDMLGADEHGGWPTYVFENLESDSTFSITVRLGEPGINYDGEYITAKEQRIYGNDGCLYTLKDEQCSLVWSAGEDSLLIAGGIESKTMINIAKGVLSKE